MRIFSTLLAGAALGSRPPHSWSDFGLGNGACQAVTGTNKFYPMATKTGTTLDDCKTLFYQMADAGFDPIGIGHSGTASTECQVYFDAAKVRNIFTGASYANFPTDCTFAACNFKLPAGYSASFTTDVGATMRVLGHPGTGTMNSNRRPGTTDCRVCTGDGCDLSAPDHNDVDNTLYYTGGYPDFRDFGTSTGRNGVSSNPAISNPGQMTGVPYQAGMNSGNPTYNAAYTDSGVTGANAAGGSACSGAGFKCDISNATALGMYSSTDFVWKVIDPDTYSLHEYDQKTLPCKVDVTNTTSGQNDWFYVPVGVENLPGTDYCATEAIRRVVDNTGLNMVSEIRLRGETARVFNQGHSDYDLIGEQFTVKCKCTVGLQTESSINIQPKNMLVRMEAAGQERTMAVELLMFSDGMLTERVLDNASFPINRATMFLLARHIYDADWDIELQINTCVGCNHGYRANCTTIDQPSDPYGTRGTYPFLKDCQFDSLATTARNASHRSWYANYNTTTQFAPTGTWGAKNPYKCPYYALGFRKFRVAAPSGFEQQESFTISCAIVGCNERPCTNMAEANSGCLAENVNEVGTDWSDPDNKDSVFNRRLLAKHLSPVRGLWKRRENVLANNDGRRRLQASNGAFPPVDVAMKVTMPFGSPNTPVAGYAQEEEEGAKPRAKVTTGSIIMLLVMLLLILLSFALVHKMLQQKKKAITKRRVEDVDITDEKEQQKEGYEGATFAQ